MMKSEKKNYSLSAEDKVITGLGWGGASFNAGRGGREEQSNLKQRQFISST